MDWLLPMLHPIYPMLYACFVPYKTLVKPPFWAPGLSPVCFHAKWQVLGSDQSSGSGPGPWQPWIATLMCGLELTYFSIFCIFVHIKYHIIAVQYFFARNL